MQGSRGTVSFARRESKGVSTEMSKPMDTAMQAVGICPICQRDNAIGLRAENERLRVIAADYHALNSRANSIGDDLALMQKEAGRLNLTVELQRQEIGKLRAALTEIRDDELPAPPVAGWYGECFQSIREIVDEALAFTHEQKANPK